MISKAAGGSVEPVKFFNMGTIRIAGCDVTALNHTIAGVPGREMTGLELMGPAEHPSKNSRGRPHRRKVWLRWNDEDLVKVVVSSQLGGERRGKYLDFPYARYAVSRSDQVLSADRVVGMSAWNGYTIDIGGYASLAMVDETRLISYDGREVPFDLAVVVPLHGGASYVDRSPGLGDEFGSSRSTRTPCRSRPARTSSSSATPRRCRHRRPVSPTSKASCWKACRCSGLPVPHNGIVLAIVSSQLDRPYRRCGNRCA